MRASSPFCTHEHVCRLRHSRAQELSRGPQELHPLHHGQRVQMQAACSSTACASLGPVRARLCALAWPPPMLLRGPNHHRLITICSLIACPVCHARGQVTDSSAHRAWSQYGFYNTNRVKRGKVRLNARTFGARCHTPHACVHLHCRPRTPTSLLPNDAQLGVHQCNRPGHTCSAGTPCLVLELLHLVHGRGRGRGRGYVVARAPWPTRV